MGEVSAEERIAHLVGVILAGGSGARFWPLSRELSPKQLLSVFGTESLIMHAIQRVLPFVGAEVEAVHIVTNERLAGAIREHLTDEESRFAGIHYLVEPLGRNTAPAIALMAATLVRTDPEAILLILPSDQVFEGGRAWHETIRAAASLAADGYLATIGLVPTRPESGFGYIESGDVLPAYACGDAVPRNARRFIEKPDVARATELIAMGGVFWNAGIFVMRATAILEGLSAQGGASRAIADACTWIAAQPAMRWTDDAVRERFAALPSLSIDHALMERSSRVAVIPAELRWSDVGSLLALETLAAPDAAGNIRQGRGVDIESTNTTVYSAGRLVATLGVQDLVVVDTTDATLVCHKDRCQEVRRVADALRLQGAEELVEPCTSLRRWGSWTTLLRGAGYQIKLVEVRPGTTTGMHRHLRHSEHWVVMAGEALVTKDGLTAVVAANESVLIPPGVAHSLGNTGEQLLKVLEVQVGEELSERDTVRLTDRDDVKEPL